MIIMRERHSGSSFIVKLGLFVGKKIIIYDFNDEK